MEPAQRSAIRKCRVRLVSDLMIEDMFDAIESRSLFTPIMLECIKAKESRPEKVRTFLDYLQRRGPDAFDLFIQCLRETDHEFVASYVLQEYLVSKNNTVQNSYNNNIRGPVSMTNNMYLGQETQGTSQGNVSRPILETQGASQGEMPSSVMETQCSGEAEMKEENMQEDNEEDAVMDEALPAKSCIQRNESSLLGSNSQGIYSITTEPQPSLPGQFSSHQVSVGTTGYSGNLTEEYKMESNPRGLLLIINNRNFRGGLSNRDGTGVDCDKLKTLFMSLGFGVDVRNNLTAQEIKETLKVLSQLDQLRNVDSLAVALLTHGSEDFLYGIDANFFSINEAFMPFTAEKCPALHHKPKFFIINACRGDAEDQGSITHTDHGSTNTACDVTNVPTETSTNHLGALFGGEYKTSNVTADVQTLPPEPRSSRIPNMKDFLVAFSTIPGHVSWRHMNEGSFFIQGFVKVFQEHAATTDVLKMLVRVNREVSRIIQHQGVQIPAPQVMLTKTWYLNPLPNA